MSRGGDIAAKKDEDLQQDKFQKVIEDYLYHQREPLRDVIMSTRKGVQPSILQRKSIAERIVLKLKDFVETFINGIGA